MEISTFVKRTLWISLVLVPLAAGDLLAQRGERGGGGGRGDREIRGGHAARSFDGGQRTSVPSLNRGEGRSRRSFSGGEDFARSFTERGVSPSIQNQRGSSFQPSPRGSFRTDRSDERPISRGLSLEQRLPRVQQLEQTRRDYQVRRPNDVEAGNLTMQRGERARRTDVEETLRRGFQQERVERFTRRRADETELEPRNDRDLRARVGERVLRDAMTREQQFLHNRRDLDQEIGARLTEGRQRREREFRDREADRGPSLIGNQHEPLTRTRERESREREVEREYHRWKDSARLEGKRVGDQRDWSGRWREGNRFQVAHRIRDEWRKGDGDHYPFRHGWWDRHGGWRFWGHYAHRFDGPWYWWTWVTAPRLAGWITFGWPTYYYWDYGPGEYIYCRDAVIYVNGRWYAPAPVFYERTVRLVEEAPDLTSEKAAQLEWLPLGVFAISHDGETKVEVLVQLAVTREGVIGGTAYDQTTGNAYPIEGVVEQKTQRTVWSYTKDGRRILMETSLFNLTQPEATGLVHYGPDDIRVIQLVRLEAPPEGSRPVSVPGPSEGELPEPAPR